MQNNFPDPDENRQSKQQRNQLQSDQFQASVTEITSEKRRLLNRLFDKGHGQSKGLSLKQTMSAQTRPNQLVARISLQNNQPPQTINNLDTSQQGFEDENFLPRITKPNIYQQNTGTLRQGSIQKSRPNSNVSKSRNISVSRERTPLDHTEHISRQEPVRKSSNDSFHQGNQEGTQRVFHHRTLSQSAKLQKKLLISNNYHFGYTMNSSNIDGATKKIEYLMDIHTGKLDATFSTACVKKVPYRAAHLRPTINTQKNYDENISKIEEQPTQLDEQTKEQINQSQNIEKDVKEGKVPPMDDNLADQNVVKLKDIDGFIKLVKENRLSLQEFIYLKKRKSAESDAYNLKVVNYSSLIKKKQNNYYTLSCRGLTYFDNQIPVEFIYLGDWLRERDQYNTIKRLSFFRKFRKWKTLKKWGKLLFNQKAQKVGNMLTQKLFIAHPVYQRLLLKHRNLCQEMEQLRFLDIQAQADIQTLDMFSSIQQVRRRNTVEQLRVYSQKLHENVRQGLKAITEKLRMQIISEISQEDDMQRSGQEMQAKGSKKKENKKTILEIMGFPEYLSYGHRAMIRSESMRFLRLAYLLDFLALDSLTGIYHESVNQFIFSMQEILEYNSHTQEGEKKKQDKEPMFYIKLLLNTDSSVQRTSHFIKKGNLQFETVVVDHEEIWDNIFDFDLNQWAELSEEKEEEVFDAKKNRQAAKNKKKVEEKEEVEVAPVIKYKRHCANIHQGWLELNPHQDDFITFFSECLKEGLASLSVIEKWSKNPEFLPYANALEEWDEVIGEKWPQGWEQQQYLNPEPWLQTGNINQVEIYRQKLMDIFEYSFKRIEKFKENFNMILNLHWRNLNIDLTILSNKRLIEPVDAMQYTYHLLQKEMIIFEEQLVAHQDLGLFRVEASNLKKQIMPIQEDVRNKLNTTLVDILRDRRTDLHTWLTRSVRELTCMVSKIEDFVLQRDNFDKINSQFAKFRIDKDNFEFLFKLINDEKLQITKDDKDKAMQLNSLESQLLIAQNEVEGAYVKNVERFKSSLADKITKLQDASVETLQKVQDQRFLVLETPVEQQQKHINELDAQTKQQEQLAVLYADYEEILQVEPAIFENLDLLRDELNLRKNMWDSLANWDKTVAVWHAQPFRSVNIKECEGVADNYVKIIKRCEKNLPTNDVIKVLKGKVSKFKDAMPVVNAINSEYLDIKHPLLPEQSHREDLVKLIGEEIPDTEDFTLEKLLQMNIYDNKSDIIELALKAHQEYNLARTLQGVEQEWDLKELVLKQYKDMHDMYVIGEIDEFMQAIDDSLAIVNGTLANKYIKPLKSRAQTLQGNLLLLSDIIEKWLECQKRWVYLENIFRSPDIKKQLGPETTLFEACDKFLKKETVKFIQQQNKVMKLTKAPTLQEPLGKKIEDLDKVEKGLEDYLETKRGSFPRFYFLSNEELIEILSKQKEMDVVQRNLRKCFEGIQQIVLNGTQIQSMISPEGEIMQFNKGSLKTQGDIEKWLEQLQSAMFETVQKHLKLGYNALMTQDAKERQKWILKNHAQIICVISQVAWCLSTEEAIKQASESSRILPEWYDINVAQLQQLIDIVRQDITPLERLKVVALITQDVKARDIVEMLNTENVEAVADFNWQKQLRYYWVEELNQNDEAVIKQCSSITNYCYEYMGATTRLVITPLTERCWMTITSALYVGLGSAPAGPAGTGKTETTKDLAKALGVLCIVFNCSDQVTCIMTSRLFQGLSQAGAWACLDEFNRIDIEVLSVIAQQLLVIRLALIQKATEFEFEAGKKIPLKPSYGCFITMNPGYAGRTELPDNLKVLFRPVSMMIPDYALIAEIMLFAEGFDTAKVLSKKMVQLYNLSSQQLSQQGHYDFGMRAVKSVLVMAGNLKRSQPQSDEEYVLIRAMQDANIPKFVKDDLPLFAALIQDLFPNFMTQPIEYGDLQTTIEDVTIKNQLQIVPDMITKVIQTYETLRVRFGIMLVGNTGCGKTQIHKVLSQSLINLHEQHPKDINYFNVKTSVLNPKSITMGELYGDLDFQSGEWFDGLASVIIRGANGDINPDDPTKRQWIVFDGPVDALWIENMNTVLDDNMTLCLANSERIKLRPMLRMIFEVQDLAVASPATVSRCGMVFISSENLGWMPYVDSWLIRQFENSTLNFPPELIHYLRDCFDNILDNCMMQLRKYGSEPFPTNDIQAAKNVCNILEWFLDPRQGFSLVAQPEVNKNRVLHIFSYAFIWGFCASFGVNCYKKMDMILREHFKNIIFPTTESIFDYYLDKVTFSKFHTWESQLKEFEYIKDMQYFEILVPTVDTTKTTFMIECLLDIQKPILITGETGVGKSVVIQNLLNDLKVRKSTDQVVLNFSAQTSSKQTQYTIENKLNKKSKSAIGAKPSRTIGIFIDDINMPTPESYGAVPVIELLRQYLDYGGIYDRSKHFFKRIEDSTLIVCGGPPVGGRHMPSYRFIRHFNVINMPSASDSTLKLIFGTILRQFFSQYNFSEGVKGQSDNIVNSTIELYQRIIKDLLPIPSKFHYTFNLRDIAKVFQGILLSRPQSVPNDQMAQKLFYHEAARIFHDRLIDDVDRQWFFDNLTQISNTTLHTSLEQDQLKNMNIIFSDFLKLDSGTILYEEIKDKKRLLKFLDNCQDDYNSGIANSDLVFFDDAVSHILRVSRAIRQSRGSMMSIGVAGSGKQSIAKLGAFIMKQPVYSIQPGKDYSIRRFREDISKAVLKAGGDNQQITLLLSDQQIVDESFLEDISNLLNTGEIPQMFQKKEEFDDIMNRVKVLAEKNGRSQGFDEIYSFFVEQTRNNLHIILCMSPIGETLRVRARKFPSLINCTTLDWFSAWPHQALKSVAERFIADMDFQKQYVEPITDLFVAASLRVQEISERYFLETKRRVYCTPKNYIIMVKLYISLYSQRKEEFEEERKIFLEGTKKLKATQEEVDQLKEEITQKQPILEEQQIKTAEFMEKLSVDKAIADEKDFVVSQQTAEVKKESQEIELVANECQKELDKAMPAMQAAERALLSLTKNDISEIKSFKQPSPAVQLVMNAVLILLGERKLDWENAKLQMSDSDFLGKLLRLDKDKITEKQLVSLRQLTNKPEFDPEIVARSSVACKSVCQWAIAMDIYSKVSQEIKPKQLKVEEMKNKQAIKDAELKEKQDELNKIKESVDKLEKACNETMTKKDNLLKDIAVSQRRIENAAKLNSLLGSEYIRWLDTISNINSSLEQLIGNCFIASATIGYLGPFSFVYRDELVQEWLAKVQELKVPHNEKYTLPNTLEQPMTLRNWILKGLPDDQLSIDNAVIASRSGRYPFFIDPQGVANKWLKQRGGSGMEVSKTSDGKDYIRKLQLAISTGKQFLIEEAGENIEALLDPILDKNVFDHEGRRVIKVSDKLVDYDPNFQLFITSKLPNPIFLPDVYIKTNVINFTVTFEGLDDQLLGDVVKNEKPEIETERDKIVLEIAADKKGLQECQDKILFMLANSKGLVLDNEALINSLEESKNRSTEIAKNLEESAIVEQTINDSRNTFRTVSKRGSVLYFVVQDLAKIDNMYQYSLEYFKNMFLKAINAAAASTDFDVRLKSMIDKITEMVYNDICHGLFEAHKKIYSFLIVTSIQRKEDTIPNTLWNLLIRGVTLGSEDYSIPNPDSDFIQDFQWQVIMSLSKFSEEYTQIPNIITTQLDQFKKWTGDNNAFDNFPIKEYNSFSRLLVIKALCPERLAESLTNYVGVELGPFFAETPSSTMEEIYNLSTAKSPIIFILSTGADPSTNLIRFSKEKDKHLQSISLGQGVKPLETMNKAKAEGTWIMLQNCHLSKSFMPDLEKFVDELQSSSGSNQPKPSFRLYLTSMPVTYFPATVLQNGLKLTTEPPKGIRANTRKTYAELNQNVFDHPKSSQLKRLLCSLTFFHAVIQERRKFGALGFNIRYEFNDSDLDMSVQTLKISLESDELDWSALQFLVGEINYGGRVTDMWDRRCLMTMLKKFICPDAIAVPKYKFSESNLYYVPDDGDLDTYKQYITDLPQADETSVFGLHENANISCKTKESNEIINIILSIQPRIGNSGSGKSTDETVNEVANDIINMIPENLNVEEGNQTHFELTEAGTIASLSTVLLQEIEKFNKLLNNMRKTIKLLTKAIQGLVTMSSELDEMYQAFINNIVPPNWKKVSYASLQPLGLWIKDLVKRIEFLRSWLNTELPQCFWISGFYFPQGFITGVLQTHARNYKIPIDKLSFKFRVLQMKQDEVQMGPRDGVFIYGLHLDGAKWNTTTETLEDLQIGQLFSEVPVIHFSPAEDYELDTKQYVCPVYKTSDRKGVLSTTGQSTNYIISVHMSTNIDPNFWTLRGIAMLCMLDN